MYPVLSQYINDACNPIGNVGKNWNKKSFTSLHTVFCQNYCRYSSWLSYLWMMRYQWKSHWIMQFSFHFTMSLGLLSGPSNTLVTNFEHSNYQYFRVSIFLFPNYNNSSVFISTYKIILHSSVCISCNIPINNGYSSYSESTVRQLSPQKFHPVPYHTDCTRIKKRRSTSGLVHSSVPNNNNRFAGRHTYSN